jgi:hypothetical protein
LLTYRVNVPGTGISAEWATALTATSAKDPMSAKKFVARGVGPANPNPLDLVAIHPGRRPQAVGRVLLERERAAPSDIHLGHRDARRQ